MIDLCHYSLSKTIHCRTPRVNYDVNDRVWVVMTFQCSFIDCDKCTTLVEMLLTGEAMDVWGRRYKGNICILLSLLL